jgi:hypothetical protein
MALHQYVVWFLDEKADPSDQDYEWLACFVIDAPSLADAKSWGHCLSEAYVSRHSANTISNSVAQLVSDRQSVSTLPIVEFVEVIIDQHIGW